MLRYKDEQKLNGCNYDHSNSEIRIRSGILVTNIIYKYFLFLLI